jgi:outer membrane usher protein
LRLHRASKAAACLITACASAALAQTTGSLNSGISITPSPPREQPATQPVQAHPGNQLLQLEVYINDRETGLIAAFMLHPDGTLSSSAAELKQIGLRIPSDLADYVEISLDALPGVQYRYDEAPQTIHFTAAANAQLPTLIEAQAIAPTPHPTRPPLGGTINYTLFASATGARNSLRFQNLSGEFQTRAFGPFGLVENSFIGRIGSNPAFVRLDSTYTYQDPAGLWTAQAGDLVSGGFSWTRPIRMAGIQIHRDFGLRPDLITIPLPTLRGTAATTSTLDLYIDQVKTLSTTIPQGPYAIERPPMLLGSGQAQVVVRDALGRETVSTTPFYASPDLLAPGLTDYSLEAGFARRSYGTVSNDYDGLLALSASYRRGIFPWLTLQAHGETAGSLILLGGGAIAKVGNIGLLSMVTAASRTSNHSGALLDVSFESRSPFLSLMVRTQRTVGDYEDLASWTAELPPNPGINRRIFDQPKALDQAAISFPLPWSRSSLGASYVHVSRTDGEKSQIAGLSFTQDFGRLSFFTNAMRDFDDKHSTYLFAGLSIPLGHGLTATAGATDGHGTKSGYVEASRQGSDEPGTLNWSARASAGQETEAYGITRYATSVAQFEGTGVYRDGTYSVTAMMEGGLSTIANEGVYATKRLDDAFAVVDVGAPNVTILRENRNAGVTNRNGKLLIPDLTPFVVNRLALDPSGLPVDAEVSETEATVTPYSRAGSLVDLRVKAVTQSALVALTGPHGNPVELGSTVRLDGNQKEFVVGYDGEAYLDNLKAQNAAMVTTPDNAICRATFHYHADAGQQVRIGPVVCDPER